MNIMFISLNRDKPLLDIMRYNNISMTDKSLQNTVRIVYFQIQENKKYN